MEAVVQSNVVIDNYKGDDRLLTGRSLRNYLAHRILNVSKIEDVSLFEKNYFEKSFANVPGVKCPPDIGDIAMSRDSGPLSVVALDIARVLDPTEDSLGAHILINASIPFETFSNEDTDAFARYYRLVRGDEIKPQRINMDVLKLSRDINFGDSKREDKVKIKTYDYVCDTVWKQAALNRLNRRILDKEDNNNNTNELFWHALEKCKSKLQHHLPNDRPPMFPERLVVNFSLDVHPEYRRHETLAEIFKLYFVPNKEKYFLGQEITDLGYKTTNLPFIRTPYKLGSGYERAYRVARADDHRAPTFSKSISSTTSSSICMFDKLPFQTWGEARNRLSSGRIPNPNNFSVDTSEMKGDGIYLLGTKSIIITEGEGEEGVRKGNAFIAAKIVPIKDTVSVNSSKVIGVSVTTELVGSIDKVKNPPGTYVNDAEAAKKSVIESFGGNVLIDANPLYSSENVRISGTWSFEVPSFPKFDPGSLTFFVATTAPFNRLISPCEVNRPSMLYDYFPSNKNKKKRRTGCTLELFLDGETNFFNESSTTVKIRESFTESDSGIIVVRIVTQRMKRDAEAVVDMIVLLLREYAKSAKILETKLFGKEEKEEEMEVSGEEDGGVSNEPLMEEEEEEFVAADIKERGKYFYINKLNILKEFKKKNSRRAMGTTKGGKKHNKRDDAVDVKGLNKIEPNIFGLKFYNRCFQGPAILVDEADFALTQRYEIETMDFPTLADSVKYGIPIRTYVCPYDKNTYIGLIPFSESIVGYAPCCQVADQQVKKTGYVANYFKGNPSSLSLFGGSSVTRSLYGGRQHLKSGATGVLPIPLRRLFLDCNNPPYRIGTTEGPFSALECILRALNILPLNIFPPSVVEVKNDTKKGGNLRKSTKVVEQNPTKQREFLKKYLRNIVKDNPLASNASAQQQGGGKDDDTLERMCGDDDREVPNNIFFNQYSAMLEYVLKVKIIRIGYIYPFIKGRSPNEHRGLGGEVVAVRGGGENEGIFMREGGGMGGSSKASSSVNAKFSGILKENGAIPILQGAKGVGFSLPYWNPNECNDRIVIVYEHAGTKVTTSSKAVGIKPGENSLAKCELVVTGIMGRRRDEESSDIRTMKIFSEKDVPTLLQSTLFFLPTPTPKNKMLRKISMKRIPTWQYVDAIGKCVAFGIQCIGSPSSLTIIPKIPICPFGGVQISAVISSSFPEISLAKAAITRFFGKANTKILKEIKKKKGELWFLKEGAVCCSLVSYPGIFDDTKSTPYADSFDQERGVGVFNNYVKRRNEAVAAFSLFKRVQGIPDARERITKTFLTPIGGNTFSNDTAAMIMRVPYCSYNSGGYKAYLGTDNPPKMLKPSVPAIGTNFYNGTGKRSYEVACVSSNVTNARIYSDIPGSIEMSTTLNEYSHERLLNEQMFIFKNYLVEGGKRQLAQMLPSLDMCVMAVQTWKSSCKRSFNGGGWLRIGVNNPPTVSTGDGDDRDNTSEKFKETPMYEEAKRVYDLMKKQRKAKANETNPEPPIDSNNDDEEENIEEQEGVQKRLDDLLATSDAPQRFVYYDDDDDDDDDNEEIPPLPPNYEDDVDFFTDQVLLTTKSNEAGEEGISAEEVKTRKKKERSEREKNERKRKREDTEIIQIRDYGLNKVIKFGTDYNEIKYSALNDHYVYLIGDKTKLFDATYFYYSEGNIRKQEREPAATTNDDDDDDDDDDDNIRRCCLLVDLSGAKTSFPTINGKRVEVPRLFVLFSQ